MYLEPILTTALLAAALSSPGLPQAAPTVDTEEEPGLTAPFVECPAYDVRLPRLDGGEPTAFEDFRGRLIVLHFGTSW